ncbi:MAG TPA: YdeI/OmpD-associated family protein [Chitinophagaceae bacterium]|nr:YdeI/OmpD-associated family protein [Chitinophagaceae bacterium]
MMISFEATIQQFGQQGEKTGWTYVLIPAALAAQLQPESRQSFRIKGKLDHHPVKAVALLPMGGGDFILPLNASLRKALGKGRGALLSLRIEPDNTPPTLDPLLLECLQDDPEALAFFNGLPGSVKNYFSKWVGSAKTEATRTKRLASAVNALARHQSFNEMIRSLRKDAR